ncbi:mitochondrial protein C2orf69 homolog [Spea bombifrons]|uniref:mitochondrial protein C2orf69 homolog n=1 Tax=Spea bombifrons TaxID=233779 RepID=UPI00234ACCD9|nr:mitochondrial protein C2orf69 homolog [Spea bombifrons]
MLLRQSVDVAVGMCAGVSSMYTTPKLFRLPAIPGCAPTKSNDMLLFPAMEIGQRPHHVIYFPGDVQNYRDVMAAHSENFRWMRWSFEDVAALLSKRFTTYNIWIVKSSRMHLHKFSCYDNFVESNMFGAPTHSGEVVAFKQLFSLLVNAFPVAQNILRSQNNKYVNRGYNLSVYDKSGCPVETKCGTCQEASAIHFGLPSVKDSLSLTLVGFSKGCVVLNQLLHELEQAKKDKDISSFIANIEAMYWLDGGHSGGSETWITHPDILKVFAETGIDVHTHVTPYQVSDSMRSWIGQEQKKFVQILKENSVMVDNRLHFMYEMPSLDNHFRVHEVF